MSTLLAQTGFQTVMSAVIAAALGGLLWRMLRGRVRRREGLLYGTILLAAGVAILWPGSTSRVAHALGIGRGADLVLYLAVIAMLIGFWMIYLRVRQIRREITLLVRHVAISTAEENPAESKSETLAENPPTSDLSDHSPSP